MSETDKSWIEYLNNRIAILDFHIQSLSNLNDPEYIGSVEAIDYYMKERNYFRDEIDKIKKANKDSHPG